METPTPSGPTSGVTSKLPATGVSSAASNMYGQFTAYADSSLVKACMVSSSVAPVDASEMVPSS